MNHRDTYRPRARRGSGETVEQRIGEETVVYDLRRQRFHSLNPVASSLWSWCDGETGPGTMARRLAKERSLTQDRARALVDLGLRRLHRAGLFDATPPPASPARREVLRRTARLALAPAVASLLAPTRVAAVSVCGFCSCLTAGSPCSSTSGGNHQACRNATTGTCSCHRFGCPSGSLFCGTC